MKIAIAGKLQHGKTTVAQYLERTYGASIVSIASQLKEKLIAAGVDREAIYKTKPDLVRELMQVYGQAISAQDEDFWIRCALEEAQSCEEFGEEMVVIDDLRFRNEARILREEGWLLVRVERTDAQDPGRVGLDISEIDLDDWEDWDADMWAKTGDLHTLFSLTDNLILREGGA